ncbi:MAG TPA: protein kinase, partial [Terriglobia bacterium]
MTPERWSRVSPIFDAALEVAPQNREAFLAEACAGDEDVLLEVKRLLAEDERAEGFLDQPVIGPRAPTEGCNGSNSASQATKTTLAGKLIHGRFAIRARLGAGGMGEVLLAEDIKLKRCVALKRVAPKMRSDECYRERLLHEARRASAINNPHIAQVYDVLEEDDETFLLMEY